MRKHKIPQEFNQHDKIGKITMPQAMILGVGAFLFVIIVITFNFIISIIAFFPIALITAVFMFFKVNRVPIYEFLMVYLVYSGTPKLLIYRSDNVKTFEAEDDELVFIEHEKRVVTDEGTKKAVKKTVPKTKSVPRKSKISNAKSSKKSSGKQKREVVSKKKSLESKKNKQNMSSKKQVKTTRKGGNKK